MRESFARLLAYGLHASETGAAHAARGHYYDPPLTDKEHYRRGYEIGRYVRFMTTIPQLRLTHGQLKDYAKEIFP